MRKFIRHSTEIPVQVSAPAQPQERRRACNVSAGGLAFLCDRDLAAGSIVHLRIEAVDPAFETDARVVWCRARGRGYEAGVEFIDAQDTFRARLVEQVCRIEMYRRTVFEHEHRELSDEEAAYDWVRRFAAAFSGHEVH